MVAVRALPCDVMQDLPALLLQRAERLGRSLFAFGTAAPTVDVLGRREIEHEREGHARPDRDPQQKRMMGRPKQSGEQHDRRHGHHREEHIQAHAAAPLSKTLAVANVCRPAGPNPLCVAEATHTGLIGRG